MGGFMGYSRKKRLGDLLVEAKVINQEQLGKALEEQKSKKSGKKLGAVLIDLGIVTERQIIEALKTQLKIESVELSGVRIPEEITKLTDEQLLRKYNLIPFGFSEKNPNILKVAMADPLDIRAIDDLSIITGFQVERYVAGVGDIAAAIDRYYGNVEALRVAEQYTKEREEQYKAKAAAEEANEEALTQAPIVKLVSTDH